jgi:probable HAF family extracellular repeat protein
MKSRDQVHGALIVLVLVAISFPLAANDHKGNRRYHVINLGTLGGTASNGYGGPNDRGWVTGDANLTGDQHEHAFVWYKGAMTDLGTLGGPNSSVSFPVKDDVGLVVGNAQIHKIDPLGEFWGSAYFCTTKNCQGYRNLMLGFLWQGDGMIALPTLGGNNGAATGANNRGQVVGVTETATHDSNCVRPQVLDFDAVIWGPKRGQIQALPLISGDVSGAALAINDRGEVVGTSGTCMVPTSFAFATHAVMWQHGIAEDLRGFGGAMNNVALAINNRGQIVGESDLPGDAATHAFLWQNGEMTDLGTLSGDVISAANDINNKGQIVGISCDANFNCRAFLWEKGVMTDLNTLIPPNSPLYLTYGGGINDKGEIAGSAYEQTTGASPAFLAFP